MTKKELKKILEQHKIWLETEEEQGKRIKRNKFSK